MDHPFMCISLLYFFVSEMSVQGFRLFIEWGVCHLLLTDSPENSLSFTLGENTGYQLGLVFTSFNDISVQFLLRFVTWNPRVRADELQFSKRPQETLRGRSLFLTGPRGSTQRTLTYLGGQDRGPAKGEAGHILLLRPMDGVLLDSWAKAELVNSNQKNCWILVGSRGSYLRGTQMDSQDAGETVSHKGCWKTHIRNLNLLVPLWAVI